MRSVSRFSRLSAVVWAVLWVLTMPACAPQSAVSDFAYADAPFSATVRGTYTPVGETVPRPIAATVSVGALAVGLSDPSAREMTVTFTEPPSMRGTTVTAVWERDTAGGAVRTVTYTYPTPYGEVAVSSEEESLAGLLRFAEALLPAGDVVSVSPVTKEGTHTVTRQSGDGLREAVFTFSAEQSLPRRVRVTDARGTVELVVSP